MDRFWLISPAEARLVGARLRERRRAANRAAAPLFLEQMEEAKADPISEDIPNEEDTE